MSSVAGNSTGLLSHSLDFIGTGLLSHSLDFIGLESLCLRVAICPLLRLWEALVQAFGLFVFKVWNSILLTPVCPISPLFTFPLHLEDYKWALLDNPAVLRSAAVYSSVVTGSGPSSASTGQLS
jgi:hypothetical protein